MSLVNFPWIGFNPYKLGLSMAIIFGLFVFPSVLSAFVGHHPSVAVGYALLPFSLGVLFCLAGLAVRCRLTRGRAAANRIRDAVYHTECMVVHGILQMPATLAVAGDSLILTPLFGLKVAVPLESLRGAKSLRWFNGQYFFNHAGGFWLPSVAGRRLGVAVPDTDAFLKRSGVAVDG